MNLSSNDLINLPVYTESAQYLGKITSVDINIDNHQISSYCVRTGLIQGLWHQHLLISPSQIISISKEKMVVSDNVDRQPDADLSKVKFSPVIK
ncbi:MAG: PRC-barrel domain-containing protein [Patescibacteria group bacterium]|jgi:sporulation protein YlmC with PRC-barrel domain|nr:PRC-barrel domain-containing protein [Patescibacteria group bacterium]